MSLLATPVEDDDIDYLRRVFPEFQGDIPDEARYWSRKDLELFMGSCGQLRPRGTLKENAVTSPFLSRLRMRLADEKVNEMPTEYTSLCRHLNERSEMHIVPDVSGCSSVRRNSQPLPFLKIPMVIRSPKNWLCSAWIMDFWEKEFGHENWTCHTRTPQFETDDLSDAANWLAVDCTVAEYVDYARILWKMDPHCMLENNLAFPRITFDGWTPFLCGRIDYFRKNWKNMLPPDLKDYTWRWTRMFASEFNFDWLEVYAKFFRVTLAAPGSIWRLHRPNNSAHQWFAQIEGRRLFVLFSPQDAAQGCLYEERGLLCEGPEGYAALCSPVDVFHPNVKKHPNFKQANPHVTILGPGETLIIPSDWWFYSAALAMSVTVVHPFWNLQNRQQIVDEFREYFNPGKMDAHVLEKADAILNKLQELIAEDDDSDMDM